MKKSRTRFLPVLMAGLMTMGGCGNAETGGSVSVLRTAVYPEMASYPNEQAYIDPDSGMMDSEGFSAVYEAWANDRAARRNQPDGYTEGTAAFTRQAAEVFLTGTDGNALISPLNIYMALGMLAEVTDGETRAQILDVLHADTIETLRNRAGSLWNANYCDDGAMTRVLASSLWLNRDVTYHQAALDSLAEVYYASAYRGTMGDPAYNRALQDWLNEQTGGLLEGAAEGVEMTPETILALASTVYYRAKWDREFQAENNAERIFHGTAGDTECTFMYQMDTYGVYHWSEQFGAVARNMEEGGQMWFILPDEGADMDAVLQSDELYRLLDPAQEWTDRKTLRIHQYIPKFDVAADTKIGAGLADMGITAVFDPENADFTPLTDTDGVCLSDAKHAVRVAIDEEGVTAASYVVMMMAGAARPPEDEMEFVLDRPFIFAITGEDGVVLFMGVVNQP